MRLVIALVVSGALSTLLGAHARGDSFTSGGPRQTAASNATDFYYQRGERVALTRSAREIVVQVRPESQPDQQRIIQGVAPGATLGTLMFSEGTAFQLIVLPAGSPDSGGILSRLQAVDGIDFAAPVYFHLTARLIPTGEIIVKLKRGLTRADLTTLLAPGLTIVRAMVGSTDEFVLRSAQGAADPLAASRMLYESGQFEWVEPNFIHELDRVPR